MARTTPVLLALLLGACTACTAEAPPAAPVEPPWERGIRVTPSFSTDIQEIFTRRGCTLAGCHGAAASLPLTAGLSHAALVNVPAVAEAAIRVVPGNAAASYLIRRVEGTQTVGSRMPLGGTPLDSIDLANLRTWIQQGARRN